MIVEPWIALLVGLDMGHDASSLFVIVVSQFPTGLAA